MVRMMGRIPYLSTLGLHSTDSKSLKGLLQEGAAIMEH